MPLNAATGNTNTGLSNVDSLKDTAVNGALTNVAEQPLQLFHDKPGNYTNFETGKLIQAHPDWIIFVILLSLVAVIIVRLYFSKIFDQMKTHLVSPAINRSSLREDDIQLRQASLLLSFNFYIIGGLFIYLLSIEHDWSAAWINSGFVRYMIFTLLLAVVFPLKILAIRMLGFIFDRLPLSESYVYNIQLTNNTLGLLLIPLTAVITYVNLSYMTQLVSALTILIAILLLLQVLKGILIWYNLRPFSLHYLIIYLCTLEIAPLLVIGKIATF